MKNTFCNASRHLLNGRQASPDSPDFNKLDCLKQSVYSSYFKDSFLLLNVNLPTSRSRFVTVCPEILTGLNDQLN